MDSPPERIFACYDIANLWKACRQEFGPLARVDFQALAEIVRSKRYPVPVHQRLCAYLVTDPKQKHHGLRYVLRDLGYQVRERHMQHHKALLRPLRTDWDVGITIDAVSQLDQYDTFVLASGDGDFGLLIDFLKTHGKRIVVLTFASAASKILYNVADELYILTKENIVSKEPSDGQG